MGKRRGWVSWHDSDIVESDCNEFKQDQTAIHPSIKSLAAFQTLGLNRAYASAAQTLWF